MSAAIVTTARLMRHDGIRLLVSTQSPNTLAPELLELLSVAVLHRFHSHDWFAYLRKKLPLDEGLWSQLVALQPGHALVFAASHSVAAVGEGRTFVDEVVIRQRITADLGASRTNRGLA